MNTYDTSKLRPISAIFSWTLSCTASTQINLIQSATLSSALSWMVEWMPRFSRTLIKLRTNHWKTLQLVTAREVWQDCVSFLNQAFSFRLKSWEELLELGRMGLPLMVHILFSGLNSELFTFFCTYECIQVLPMCKIFCDFDGGTGPAVIFTDPSHILCSLLFCQFKLWWTYSWVPLFTPRAENQKYRTLPLCHKTPSKTLVI